MHVLFVFAILVAAVALCSTTPSASANEFAISEPDIRVAFDPVTLASDIGEIICDITLEGSIHDATFSKEQQLLGYITRAISELPGCTDTIAIFNPNVSVTSESLPWHVVNAGWTGTLPNIAEVYVSLRSVGLLMLGGITPSCRYLSDLGTIVSPGSEESPIQLDESVEIPSPSEGCPALVFAASPARVTVLEGGEDVLITLGPGEQPDPARLDATPTSIAVTGSEQNDVFRIRNVDGDTTASSIEVEVVTDDEREPEFELRSPTCTETLAAGESCTYTIVVNSRPEADGRVVIDYRDGTGDLGRTVSVDVDIES